MRGLPESLPGDGHEAFTGLLRPECAAKESAREARRLSIPQDPTETPYSCAAEIAAALPALVKGQTHEDHRPVASLPGRIAQSPRPAS